MLETHPYGLAGPQGRVLWPQAIQSTNDALPARSASFRKDRPARFTTAELRRALNAAEQAGPEWLVDILPDGTMRIKRSMAEKPPELDWDDVVL